jgi:16S rRNA (adenine1518-N6/adenine1519-N6)-dimethyltransferase
VSTRDEIRSLLARHHIRLKRSLGQSFLVDADVLEQIARLAGRDRPRVIIEIGAGLGTLTRELANRADKVIAIERDASLIPILREELGSLPGVEIVEADALALDLASLAPGAAIAGNLPYSITSPLLLALHAQRGALGSATIMIQREVADRLTADPGSKDYGSLSILFQAWADVSSELDVPPECFIPPPRVHSRVLAIDWLDGPRVPIADPVRFERLVRDAFSQRRKTLRNSLGRTIPRAILERASQAAGIVLDRRAETLTLAEFSKLASALAPWAAGSKAPSDR